MDSDPFPVLEKSHSLRGDQIHCQPQEKRFDFRHSPLGTKIIKTYGRQSSEDYLPDAYDVERKSYAANQSPKFTGQFPFTSESGDVMVEGLKSALKLVAI